MISRCTCVAFQGVEARLIDVQCVLSAGLPSFRIVGLPDKAVSEAKERVRAAILSLGLALPAKRITINMSPADLPKEGSHFDLPIALCVLAAMGILPNEEIASVIVLGELSLDGTLVQVAGCLPAAMAAGSAGLNIICPAPCGAEAAWVGTVQVLAPNSLMDLLNHFSGKRALCPAEPGEVKTNTNLPDLADVKGQERAKRALEIAATGRHHLLMVGPPGAGKSMLAARLPSILPPLSAAEALDTSMIHSLAGLLSQGGIPKVRPFRDPHHTASMAAIVGGGRGAKPGEISLAHNGVLFLDELPEFPRMVLETLRQPLETRHVMVARANAHIRYPCSFLLVAAANPCRCGYLADPAQACGRAPLCGADYMARISGPLLDRFDLRIDLPAIDITELQDMPRGENSATVAARIAKTRKKQDERFAHHADWHQNADIEGEALDHLIPLDTPCRELLTQAAQRFKLTARGYHRVLRVARSIADLDDSDAVERPHVAEALSYRFM